jgi:beta-glucosidase
MVLLKNDGNILPLDKEKTEKILVLGVLGDTENIGDHGSSKVHPYYTVTPLRGFMKKMPCAQVLYNDGTNLERARELAADADLVIIVADIFTARKVNSWLTEVILQKWW